MKIILFTCFLFLLINFSQSSTYKSNHVMHKHQKKQAESENQFLINFIFAFFILPFLLIYAQGQQLHQDFELQILLAIFCWIIILSIYFIFSHQYNKIFQFQKIDEKQATPQQNTLKHSHSYTEIKNFRNDSAKQKKIKIMQIFQNNELFNYFNKSKWIIKIMHRNSTTLIQMFQMQIFCENQIYKNLINIKANCEDKQFQGKIRSSSISQFLELECPSGFHIYTRIIRKKNKNLFEGIWQKKNQSGPVIIFRHTL